MDARGQASSTTTSTVSSEDPELANAWTGPPVSSEEHLYRLYPRTVPGLDTRGYTQLF